MRSEFPNTVVFGGFLEQPRELLASAHSGVRTEALVRNPSDGRKDDTIVKVLGFGKKAKSMLELEGALVVVTGRFGPSLNNSNYVVVDQVHAMDEEAS